MSEGRPHRTTVVSRAQEEQPAASARQAIAALESVLTTAKGRLRDRVIEAGRPSRRGAESAIVGVTPVAAPRISSVLFEQRQVAVHALAHLATEVEAAREILSWAERRADRLARRLADAFVAEAILRARHGIAVAPGEVVTWLELDISDEEVEKTVGRAALVGWAQGAGGSDAMQNLAESSLDGDALPASGRDDDEDRDQRRARLREAGGSAEARDASTRVALAAWGAAGAFASLDGETAARLPPVDPKASALDESDARVEARLAAADALEEIGRRTPALGPAVIDLWAAAALISVHGDAKQKEAHLPKLARGASVAVISLAEPNVPGIGAPRTCAESTDDGRFALFGDKTATLHVPDPDLLVLLARTDTTRAGVAGSSLFLAAMPAGSSGVSIEADGAIAFDGFEVASGGVLGGTAGHAATQLDTALAAGGFAAAAIDVGIAEAALEIAAAAARERLQGAAPLVRRPRVAARLGRLVALTAAARRAVAAAARAQIVGDASTATAIARLASSRAAKSAIGIAGDFAALLGRRPPAELATMSEAVRAAAAFGSDDDAAEALARRLLA